MTQNLKHELMEFLKVEAKRKNQYYTSSDFITFFDRIVDFQLGITQPVVRLVSTVASQTGVDLTDELLFAFLRGLSHPLLLTPASVSDNKPTKTKH